MHPQWIIEYELFVFLITAVLTAFPSMIPRGRLVALTFLATALVLVGACLLVLQFYSYAPCGA
jgi:hypothetical protein